MNVENILETLRNLGSEKNRQAMLALDETLKAFGVSEARLNQYAEKIGKDRILAESLWFSGIVDAQLLACRIADPAGFDVPDATRWAECITVFPVADMFTDRILIPAGLANPLTRPWLASSKPLICRIGYRLLAYRARADNTADNDEFLQDIYTIEKKIHTASDEVKEAMHQALIAIGERSRVLNTEALIIGMRIGPVIIRRGGKDVTLPDAFKILGNKKLKERLKTDNRK